MLERPFIFLTSLKSVLVLSTTMLMVIIVIWDQWRTQTIVIGGADKYNLKENFSNLSHNVYHKNIIKVHKYMPKLIY
jgi:hypothetical protein